MKNKIDWSKYGILFAWIILIVAFSIIEPAFIKVTNVLNILRQVAIIGVCSVGMTMVILTGGMDLSVGSVIGVSAVAGSMLLSRNLPYALVLLIVIGIGVVSGAVNAFFINKIEIAPIIMTLGMMTSLRGLAYILSDGFPIYGIPEGFLTIGQGYVGPIPVPVIIMILCFIVGYIILNKMVLGRSIYGIGGNDEAARLAGVNVKKIIYKVYCMAGGLYALAGLILMARVNSGQPKAGEGYEMDVITGCVLGGISISGGEGKITGVIIGVLLMGTLTNGMVLLNIPEFWQRVVKGIVLILAVSVDSLAKKQKERSIA